MAKEVRLPQLGQTMEEGTVVNCMVKVDDEVKKGDVIFEIETDKATLEMESPAAGYVKHIVAEIDQTLPVGDMLLILGDKDEEVSQDFIDSLKAGAAVSQVPSAAPPAAGAKAQNGYLGARSAEDAQRHPRLAVDLSRSRLRRQPGECSSF